MKKTQMKRSKIWVTQMSMQTIKSSDGSSRPAPMFSTKWKLKTVADGNDKGSWYSWQIEKIGLVDTLSMYNECKEFHKNVSTGAVKSSAISDDLPPVSTGTDEVPF